MEPGTQLGHYTVLAAIGKGGMGEVWRARDTKLGREVAIKTLPAEFAQDADRLARFEREAKLLASLNHPNIAAIHGLEEQEATRFLVLELVEGDTLADRLKRGAIPAEESLKLALQVAEALEAAHEKGVIHRDLKPANIKVTPDGRVKVLDFGLAKALAEDERDVNLSNSPTISMAATQQGVILGTAAYMSPEQAKGRAVDRRTDIFAFGCVLYEMLCAGPAFDGDDVTEILGAVVRLEPDWTKLPAAAGSRVRELLRLCLEKNPKNRLSDAADLRLLIDHAAKKSTAPPSEATLTKPLRGREYLWAAVAVLSLLAAATLAVRTTLTPQPESRAVHFEVAAPEGMSLPRGSQYEFISPDGRTIAFVGNSEGKSAIWVRPLDFPTPLMLQGTEGAYAIFWSADSHDIGFFAQGNMKRISATGGPVQIICNEPQREAAWSSQGVILIGGLPGKPLLRVSATGGEPMPLGELDQSRKEISQDYPDFLPDGRHFLYMSRMQNGYDLYVGSLDSNERKLIPGIKTSAKYSTTGHIIFGRNDTLMAQPFDIGRMELSGDPLPIAEMSSPPRPFFSVSTSGSVSFLPLVNSSDSQWTWFDRVGKQTAAVGPVGEYSGAQVSLDGKYVAFVRPARGAVPPDVWITDLEKGLTSRFTTNPGVDRYPVWSPDGKTIVFLSNRSQSREAGFYTRVVGAVGEDKLLIKLAPGQSAVPSDWSRDGKYLAYESREVPGSNYDIWALPLTGDPNPVHVTETPFDERVPRISPDGAWIAYESNETGGEFPQVYIQAFPNPSFKQQVSTAGGVAPRWRPDGTELFYVAPDNTMMAVSIKKTGPSLEVGVPQALFKTNIVNDYSVSTDGRFLIDVGKTDTAENHIAVILNWTASLKK